MRTLRIGICVFLSFLPYAWAGECGSVLSVENVAKHAAALDGKIVCVRGIEPPSPVPEWDTMMFTELVPIPYNEQRRPSADTTLGLLEWSPETGISEKYYKPDSFDLLLEGRSKGSKITNPLEVTLRAAVAYKRHLLSQTRPITPPAPSIDKMLAQQHSVELIVLEILRVRNIGHAK
jgi:hypothetical protein